MEKTEIAKYTIKDSLFTNLFQDKKIPDSVIPGAPPRRYRNYGR